MLGEQQVNIGQLKGRHVIDSRGVDLGEVRDVAIDPAGWRVTGIVVDVRREVAESLRLERPFLGSPTLEISTSHVQSLGDTVLLSMSTDEMVGAIR